MRSRRRDARLRKSAYTDMHRKEITEETTKARRRVVGRLQKWSEELTARRAKLRAEAERLGLKQFSSEYSRVWVEQDYVPGALPARFFLEQYMRSGEPGLEEYRITFPINDPLQLIETIKAVDAFYAGVTDALPYWRHGIEGLIEFLEDLHKAKPD